MDVEFEDVTFKVRAKFWKPSESAKCILKSVSGKFEAGHLSAILGPSGAGKSSLLNAISGFRSTGVTAKSLKVNGQVRDEKLFRKLSCYITQEEVLQPLLSLHEVMMFAADLKLPSGTTLKHKTQLVNEIQAMLGLKECCLTRTEMLSGGQKKRLSIALELINNPPVIFLDEPTSGLDNVSTTYTLKLLRRLAHQGRTIVCTIHQPSASLFQLFDHVYVLSRGRCVYQGATDQLVSFLSSVGFNCPTHYNPADYGAFLIPYLIMLALAGKPMYFLELAIGQFGGVGPLALWNCCPIAQGVGVAMVTVSLIVCIYYNVIMSYTIYYMVASVSSVVPWSICDPAWANMSTCYVRSMTTSAKENSTSFGNVTFDAVVNSSNRETASLQYWEKRVLNLSSGIEEIGTIKFDLSMCLLISWVIVVLCLVKGIKTSGKVVYFAATFPYCILFTLLVTGLMQEGAMSGVIYFLYPDWRKLLDIQVWQAAAGQMFFSLSVSMGGLIMYSSYNDFRNNVYRDALVVSVMDTITSMISGIVTFSILGAMAHDLNVPIRDVVKDGPGLAFVAYPEALLRLPFPQLWSVLFFLMLFILGLDSEFALLENVLTSLSDEFAVLRNNKLAFCIFTAVVSYGIGLTCVTNGGNYVLTLMDVYGGGIAVLVIAIAECIFISWVYGLNRLCRDLKFMLGFAPGIYWRLTWGFCAPVILSSIFIYSLIDFKPLTYEDYDYPEWADILGWGLSLLSIIQIPLWAVISIIRTDAPTWKEKIRKSCRARESWGPSDTELKREWLEQPLLGEQEENSRTTPGDKSSSGIGGAGGGGGGGAGGSGGTEYKLKKEVVAKLSQNEGNSKNQVNGLLSKTNDEENPQSYPGHYFSV